jgi:hypothetical protein
LAGFWPAKRLQRFHRPIPQALFDKALARLLGIAHLSERNQQQARMPRSGAYSSAAVRSGALRFGTP